MGHVHQHGELDFNVTANWRNRKPSDTCSEYRELSPDLMLWTAPATGIAMYQSAVAIEEWLESVFS